MALGSSPNQIVRAADTRSKTHHAHVPPDHPAYKATVAEPMMQAIDSMPVAWRALVHECGYVASIAPGARVGCRRWMCGDLR